MTEPHGGLPCDGCPSCHAHRWQNGPTTRREVCDPSPCSTSDDHLRTDLILTQTCECGATRRLWIGYENRRRRGDDRRRAKGLPPLGVPLRRSETFDRPRVLR